MKALNPLAEALVKLEAGSRSNGIDWAKVIGLKLEIASQLMEGRAIDLCVSVQSCSRVRDERGEVTGATLFFALLPLPTHPRGANAVGIEF